MKLLEIQRQLQLSLILSLLYTFDAEKIRYRQNNCRTRD